jgi:hypothetical protein
MKQRDPDASKNRKLLITKPLKNKFQNLNISFCSISIKTFSLYLQINRLFAGFAWGIAAASFCEAIAKQKIQRIADGFLPRPCFENAQNDIIEIDI